MLQVAYGLNANGVVDSEWLWDEVSLRAQNNYGQWEDISEASNFILRSLAEIAVEAKMGVMSFKKLLNSETTAEEVRKIRLEMSEGLEG